MFVQTEVTPNPNSLKFLPGKIVSNKPPGSDFNGQVLKEEMVEVKIPAGVEDGMQLRVSGKGNEPITDGVPGD